MGDTETEGFNGERKTWSRGGERKAWSRGGENGGWRRSKSERSGAGGCAEAAAERSRVEGMVSRWEKMEAVLGFHAAE